MLEVKQLKQKEQALERKHKIIEMYLNKKRKKTIAIFLNEPYNFVSEVISHYKAFGKINENMIGRPSKIDEKHINFVKECLEKNKGKYISLEEIQTKLIEAFHEKNNNFKISLVRKIIKLSKYTRKKTLKIKIQTNSEEIKKERFEKVLQMANMMSFGSKFIYIDESSINKKS